MRNSRRVTDVFDRKVELSIGNYFLSVVARDLFLGCNFFAALHAGAIDQVEQKDREQAEEQDHQEWAQVPEIGDDHVSCLGDFFDRREDWL